MSLSRREKREQKTVSIMIQKYCSDFHSSNDDLCEECSILNGYALKRIDHCPLLPGKPVCSSCPVHCYKAIYKEQIKKVMRYAGPRMLFQHPYLAIMHLLDKKFYKPPGTASAGFKDSN